MILNKALTQRISADIQSAVERGLEAKGVSARRASLDVVGHDGLIRDIRMGRMPSVDRLVALLSYLEVDLGPKSAATGIEGFAEAAAEKIDQSIDGSPEALRMGYLPIPYHDAQRIYSGAAPVAVARMWLRDELLEPENLRFVIAPDNALAPRAVEGALALIDISDKATTDAGLFAFVHRGKIGLGWITAPNPKDIVLSVGQDQPTITVFSGPDRADLRLLGRVQAIFNPMVSKEDFNAP